MEFLTLLKKRDYHMQFKNFLDFLKKMWTIICHFWSSFPLSKIMDYHMLFMEFFSFLQKHGLSYAISETFFTSPKTWTIVCNLWYFFPFSKNMEYHIKFQI